jgi:hypothetical protein
MLLRDNDIFALIERIGENYRTNISNRFVRVALNYVELDAETRERVESLAEKSAEYRLQGFYLDELYNQILAVARFIYQARKQILPNLRSYQSSHDSRSGVNDPEKVLRDMAFANLSPNLKVLSDQLNELYMKTIALDKKISGEQNPVFKKIPELASIGRYMIE